MDRRTQRVPRPVLPYAAGLGPDHRLSCLAREGLGEFRHVTHYTVNAILFRGMGVGDGAGAITNPHSPEEYRINGVVSNMPEFAKAFSCKAGQPMVRPQACRVW